MKYGMPTAMVGSNSLFRVACLSYRNGMEHSHEGDGGNAYCPASDLVGVQVEQLRLISHDPTVMLLIGKLWGASRAITDGVADHTRSPRMWRAANIWVAFMLAGAPPRESGNNSEIGEEAAESASIAGVPEQGWESMGPRSKHLEVSENVASF